MRERDQAAAYMHHNMYHYGGSSGSFAASPGGGNMGGPMGSMGGNGMGGMGSHYLNMAHSFSSPVERPEIFTRGASGGIGALKKSATAADTAVAAASAAVDTAAAAAANTNDSDSSKDAEKKKMNQIPSLKEAI